MKNTLKWTSGMHFTAQAGENVVSMDSKPPLGKGAGQTPKELVLAGLGGCTAMDVAALLKKHKQTPETFEIDVEADSTETGHPVIFKKAFITFRLTGKIDPQVLLESVRLSQTKYCGVSAMISKAIPIEYAVILNNEEIGRGHAQFT